MVNVQNIQPSDIMESYLDTDTNKPADLSGFTLIILAKKKLWVKVSVKINSNAFTGRMYLNLSHIFF